MKQNLQYFAGLAVALLVGAGCLAFAAKEDGAGATKAFVGARIIDGTGKSAFSGDIAIADGWIAGVGGKQGLARREIDATGLMAIEDLADKLHKQGLQLLLCDARPQPALLMKRADFKLHHFRHRHRAPANRKQLREISSRPRTHL